MRKLLLILCCFPLLMAATCEDQDDNLVAPIHCSEEAVAGLNVQVKDAATGGYLSDGVIVTAQEGTYTETLELVPNSSPATFTGAWERAGTYVLTVEKDGYQSFVSSEIHVGSDACHVIPQSRTFELTPN